MGKSIALATYAGLPVGHVDDAPLVRALQQEGLEARFLPWDDPAADWTRADLVLIRTTWDYYLFADRFLGWVDRLARDGVQVWNPPAVLRWNSDKQYLARLASAGVPTVPTHVVPQDSQDTLASLLQSKGWDEVVVKPGVSAGAWGTFRATRAQPMEHQFAQQRAHGAVLVQPYLPEVQQGEWSFVFFDRQFSHAVLKRPAVGDFRVQEKHGGSLAAVEPTPGQVAEARSVLDAVKDDLLYARVDMVQRDGRLTLMELEVLEPQLFFTIAPGSSARCAQAVLRRLA